MRPVSKSLLFVLLCGLARTAVAQSASAPLPVGARRIEEGRYVSPRSFRQTVEFYRQALAKTGVAAEITPVTKVRDLVYVRILPKDAHLSWSAIHVMLAEGKTTIYIVEPKK